MRKRVNGEAWECGGEQKTLVISQTRYLRDFSLGLTQPNDQIPSSDCGGTEGGVGGASLPRYAR